MHRVDGEAGGVERRDAARSDVLLDAVLEGITRTGTDAVVVLEPVVGPTGEVDDFRILVSAGLTRRLASSVGSSIGRTVREVVAAPYAEELVRANRAVLLSGRQERSDFTLPSVRGEPLRTAETVRSVVGGLIVVLWRDVTEARRLEHARELSEQRFRRLVEHASDAVLVVGADRAITYASPALRTLLGRAPEEVLGERFGDAALPEDREAVLDLLERADSAPGGTSVTAQVRLRHLDGHFRWVRMTATACAADPAVGGTVVNVDDVTQQREAELLLQEQALRDPLTGLPNRRGFEQAVAAAVARCARSQRPFGVLLIDVDDFKVVNDRLGHPTGDRLLVELARRMVGAVRPADTVARLGGDEFVVIAEDLLDPTYASVVARRVAEHASGRYVLGPVSTHVTLSIGVATTHDSEPPCLEHEEVLAHADAALYEAKRQGRNRIEVSDPALRQRVVERLRLEEELQRALNTDGELLLHWLPVVRAVDRRVVGVEALLRWRHPERGLLRAAEFLPVAASAGFGSALCEWGVRAAIAQAARWAQLADAPVVSINLVLDQLVRPGVVADLVAMAGEQGVPAERLRFEVSEGVLETGMSVVRERLLELRAAGFSAALDNFGAGGSALTWLRQLPLDALKLHASFAAGVHEEQTRAVVTALVSLAATLGMQAVAEGVESEEQLRLLVAAGCTDTQGFLHGMPLGEREMTAVLAAGGRL